MNTIKSPGGAPRRPALPSPFTRSRAPLSIPDSASHQQPAALSQAVKHNVRYPECPGGRTHTTVQGTSEGSGKAVQAGCGTSTSQHNCHSGISAARPLMTVMKDTSEDMEGLICCTGNTSSASATSRHPHPGTTPSNLKANAESNVRDVAAGPAQQGLRPTCRHCELDSFRLPLPAISSTLLAGCERLALALTGRAGGDLQQQNKPTPQQNKPAPNHG